MVQEQAAKAADVAAEVEQEAASLQAASTSAQEDSLAAAAALARLGEDLRKSEVRRGAPPQRAYDFCFVQHMCASTCARARSVAPLQSMHRVCNLRCEAAYETTTCVAFGGPIRLGRLLQGARLDTQRALAEERVAKEMVQERCASMQQVRCPLQCTALLSSS